MFLDVIDLIAHWVSPRLQIQFEMGATDLRIFHPNGQPFLTYVEIAQQAEQERQRAEQAEAKTKRLADRLREMGIDADQIQFLYS
ncbi:hypothetical protein [Trichothermofontia sichuanensis]|uniref:hypothetical protein n=1 Tax=Trichothermofontia sichuanensis TaxID=3045816 RepID=UPI0036F2F92C